MQEVFIEAQHWVKMIELDHQEFGNTKVVIRLNIDEQGNESIIIESYIYIEQEDVCYNISEEIKVSDRKLGLDIIKNFSEEMAINFIERQAEIEGINLEIN